MITIRQPAIHELDAWWPLWQSYIKFYQSHVPDHVSKLTWARFHDGAEPLYILAAYYNDIMAGFVSFTLHRSTWAEHHYCYLEDLFVDETQRGTWRKTGSYYGKKSINVAVLSKTSRKLFEPLWNFWEIRRFSGLPITWKTRERC